MSATLRHERQLRFMLALAKALDGDELTTLERHLLSQIGETLLRGDDAREIVGTAPATNRPRDTKAGLRALWCARDVAHLHIAGKRTVKDAKEAAERRWRMTEDQVRRAWLKHGPEAREFVLQLGNAKAGAYITHQRRGAGTTR